MVSYCVFKKKYKYIKYLWDYNQPEDSDAHWTSSNIFPNNVNELIDRYYFTHDRSMIRLYQDEHHGLQKYMDEQFILLLACFHTNKIRPSGISQSNPLQYNLKSYDNFLLKYIKDSIENLKSVSKQLANRDKDLAILGFDPPKNNTLFKETIVSFLDQLEKGVVKKLKGIEVTKKIDQDKVAEFKKNFIADFYKTATFRILFDKYGLIENNVLDPYLGKLGRFGYNGFYDKAAFFKKWHIHYLGIMENFGNELATSENIRLLLSIAKNCSKIEFNTISEALKRLSNQKNIVIIATNIYLYRILEKDKLFSHKWQRDIGNILDINGFEGWYKFNELNIPVFKIYDDTKIKRIYLINFSKEIKLEQYSPLNKGDDPNLLNDIFFMDVKAYTKNEELYKNIISNPPDWLAKIESEEKQREYLDTKASIRIYERFSLNISDGFEGFLDCTPNLGHLGLECSGSYLFFQ